MVSKSAFMDYMDEVNEIYFWVGDSENGMYSLERAYEYDLLKRRWDMVDGRYSFIADIVFEFEYFLSKHRGEPICINDNVRSPRAGNVLINTIPSDFVRD